MIGHSMPQTRKSAAQVQQSLLMYDQNGDDFEALETAQVEDLMINSCLACPEAKTRRQRLKYFSTLEFRGLEQLLRDAAALEFI